MKPSARCLGDQLLAILHDHPEPMSTADLAASAPASVEIYVGCEAHWHSRVRSARTQMEICYGNHHIHLRAHYAREIYETLRTLASEGEVTRLRACGDPTVY